MGHFGGEMPPSMAALFPKGEEEEEEEGEEEGGGARWGGGEAQPSGGVAQPPGGVAQWQGQMQGRPQGIALRHCRRV